MGSECRSDRCYGLAKGGAKEIFAVSDTVTFSLGAYSTDQRTVNYQVKTGSIKDSIVAALIAPK
jgi:hypothetical protein